MLLPRDGGATLSRRFNRTKTRSMLNEAQSGTNGVGITRIAYRNSVRAVKWRVDHRGLHLFSRRTAFVGRVSSVQRLGSGHPTAAINQTFSHGATLL
jgi:hypothetical protein